METDSAIISGCYAFIIFTVVDTSLNLTAFERPYIGPVWHFFLQGLQCWLEEKVRVIANFFKGPNDKCTPSNFFCSGPAQSRKGFLELVQDFTYSSILT